jgi:hypothetical protein
MNQNTFYLLVAMVLVIVLYVYNNYHSKLFESRDMFVDKIEINQNSQKHLHPFQRSANILQDIETQQTLISKDYERVINPLLPPERSYPYRSPGLPINIPTRGESGTYSQVGALTSTDSAGDPVVMPLYGKPLYPGCSKWLYYTSTDKMPSVKLPLTNKSKDCGGDQGCEEINANDTINVPAYAGRDFTVSIYQMDYPRYIPFV